MHTTDMALLQVFLFATALKQMALSFDVVIKFLGSKMLPKDRQAVGKMLRC